MLFIGVCRTWTYKQHVYPRRFLPQSRELNRWATLFRGFKVCFISHVSLRMFILTDRNAELAVSPLFWQVNCIKVYQTRFGTLKLSFGNV